MVVRPQDTQQLHPPTNQPKVQPDCCQSEYQTSADFPSWSQQTKTQPSHPPAPASERETHSWSPTTPVTSPAQQPPPPSHSTAHEPHSPPTPPTPSPYQKSHGSQYQTASPHTHQPSTSPRPPPPAPTTAPPPKHTIFVKAVPAGAANEKLTRTSDKATSPEFTTTNE